METIISIVIYAAVTYLLIQVVNIVLDMSGLSNRMSGTVKTMVSIGGSAAITWMMKSFLDSKIVTPLTDVLVGDSDGDSE